MLLKGEVEVRRAGKRLGFLSEGSFFGENPCLASGEGTVRFHIIGNARICPL